MINDRVERYKNRFNTVITYFTADRLALFVAPSLVPTYLASLSDIVAKMVNAIAGKVGGGNAEKVGAIQTLRLDAANIHRTAVALEPTNPGMAGKFPLAEHSDQSVVDTVDGYLKQLEIQPTDSAAVQAQKTALGQLFVQHDLAATFVADLRTDRNDLPPLATAQEAKRQDKVLDTSALETLISQGNQKVNLLDAAVHNKLGRDADAMRAWKSASHLERAPHRAKAAAKSTSSATAADAAEPPPK